MQDRTKVKTSQKTELRRAAKTARSGIYKAYHLLRTSDRPDYQLLGQELADAFYKLNFVAYMPNARIDPTDLPHRAELVEKIAKLPREITD